MTEQQQKDALYELCKRFVKAQRISCGEAVYQSDRVIENAYDLVFDICEIIGYDEDTEMED